ncbi:hypothetical protein CPB83DRAFT_907954 [Crepidotus variabilis]|uniref:F-box domain-containing protein n=1 Tax=Crepidotus variabilis TaxID=179855 RepID=A0A9P6EDW5_9AGAR|nr:hypothetical protein CPB83DRAFT_907954 [Crepidotus variabilis]
MTLSSPRPSTEPCPHCHISGPGGSKIRDDVLIHCLKNCKDTCVGCQKLLDIERKIHEARRTLDELLKEKEALASTLNEHHDPLSHQLPVEITSQIFLHCLQLSPEDLITRRCYMEKYLIKSVLLPGKVSKHWRNIAKRTPSMWSIICVTLNQNNYISSGEVVRQWLELSADSPLFIQLDVDPTMPVTDEVVGSILEKVIQQSHRWKLLDLDVPNDLLPWISNAMLSRYPDCLEHIKLGVMYPQSDLTAEGVLNLHASPRRLTQGNVRLRQIAMNMDHLTHFYSTYLVEMDDCITLFQVAPRLTFCDFLGAVIGSPSSNVVVNSASLQTLKVSSFMGMSWRSRSSL